MLTNFKIPRLASSDKEPARSKSVAHKAAAKVAVDALRPDQFALRPKNGYIKTKTVKEAAKAIHRPASKEEIAAPSTSFSSSSFISRCPAAIRPFLAPRKGPRASPTDAQIPSLTPSPSPSRSLSPVAKVSIRPRVIASKLDIRPSSSSDESDSEEGAETPEPVPSSFLTPPSTTSSSPSSIADQSIHKSLQLSPEELKKRLYMLRFKIIINEDKYAKPKTTEDDFWESSDDEQVEEYFLSNPAELERKEEMKKAQAKEEKERREKKEERRKARAARRIEEEKERKMTSAPIARVFVESIKEFAKMPKEAAPVKKDRKRKPTASECAMAEGIKKARMQLEARIAAAKGGIAN